MSSEAIYEKIVISVLLILAWTGAFAQTPEPVFEELPGPGKTCRIGDAYTFTYEFDKTPKDGHGDPQGPALRRDPERGRPGSRSPAGPTCPP